MKKLFALALAALMVLSMAACSAPAAEETAAPATEATAAEAAAAPAEEGPVMKKIKESGKLVVGTEAQYAPYEFKGSGRQLRRLRYVARTADSRRPGRRARGSRYEL